MSAIDNSPTDSTLTAPQNQEQKDRFNTLLQELRDILDDPSISVPSYSIGRRTAHG